MPAAEVLAAALAIEPAAAAEWVENARREADMVSASEDVIAESLLSLALGNKPNPMTVGSAAPGNWATSSASEHVAHWHLGHGPVA